ncbi:MAG TPA: glycosyltransferase [Solirubrobacteraceae bacterium]|nr:glycosyltransferase [Solirubrobacteraceae bacterium]
MRVRRILPPRVVVVDGYYGPYLHEAHPFDRWLWGLPVSVSRAAARYGALRGVLLFIASIRAPAIALVRQDRGWRTLLLTRALLGRRRKLIALQFIAPAPEPGRLPRLRAKVERWALRRALRAGHVLTRAEVDLYARRLDLDPGRFAYIPWYRATAGANPPEYAVDGGLLSAGRAFCDWETLLAATGDLPWPLTVVCSAEDRPRVVGLDPDGRVDVRSEIPVAEYRALLRGAALAVFAMHDGGVSQGQVRLSDAADAGVPVVVTATASLVDYVMPGVTAVTVPVGDPRALRAAISALMAAPAGRRELRDRAARHASAWTSDDYWRAVEALLHGRPPEIPADPHGQPT